MHIKISIVFISLMFLGVHVAYSQSDPIKNTNEDSQWLTGLHLTPEFSSSGFTGMTFAPGIYRLQNRVMVGFAPYYTMIRRTYPASSIDPDNIDDYSRDSFGGVFQLRYYLSNKRFRPYIHVQAGLSYNSEHLDRLPQYGNPMSNSFWQYNVGAGLGVTYKINKNWSVDINLVYGAEISDYYSSSGYGDVSIGIFRRIGK